MLVYDRHTDKYITNVEYKERELKFLYCTLLGRIILKLVVARPYFSKLCAMRKNSKRSEKDIYTFIDKYNVNVEGYDLNRFNTFNEFFTRKREIPNEIINASKLNELVAIADAKLSTYDITSNLKLWIKNSIYDLADIIGDEELAKEFAGGTCLIYRLAMDDYHRYHYLDNGVIKESKYIKGELHSIRPISNKYKVYNRNCRVVNVLDTENFGKVVQVEVGATLVGHIVNHEKEEFKKLDEKGYFEYGGSTIVLLLNKGIKIDSDIWKHVGNGVEVQVRIGEKIGSIEVE